MTDPRTIAELIARPYLRAIERGEDGAYTAWIVEIPNVLSEGDSADDALANLEDAFAGVLRVMLDEQRAVPEPYSEREFSGRLQLRIPPSLHRRVAIRAEAEGVSINRVLSDAVARHIGTDRPAEHRRGGRRVG
ncbi:MAG: toxin-antitoxin system HicB family antitoxin [Dehalococcoidia bacterium]